MNSPKLHIIKNSLDIVALMTIMMANDVSYVAFDTETTGVKKGSQIVGISICFNEESAYYIIMAPENLRTVVEFLAFIKQYNLVMHNGIFDCGMVEDNFKVSLINSLHTDSMILAHLLNENRPVGLKPLAASYYGWEAVAEADDMKESVIANGGEWSAKNKEMWKADPMILGKYGAKDAWLTFKIFYELVPELYEQKLDTFFYDDESMPLLRGPTYELNRTGLRVDTQALTMLKQQMKAECAEDLAFISSELKTRIDKHWIAENRKFNLNSNNDLAELLFGVYALEFAYLTKLGKKVCKAMDMKLPYTVTHKRNFIFEVTSRKDETLPASHVFGGKSHKVKAPWKYIATDNKVLAKFASKYKWIERLLSYKKKMKLLSTYVEGIEERMEYGIIRPSFLQHGTTSGRYSSRNPNFQNLPRDDKRIKSCICARPGKVFVGADYSQLEPRVFAYYSHDSRLLAAFDGKNDFYSVIGRETFGKFECTTSKDDDDKQSFKNMFKGLRQDTKVFCLAVTYGGTAWQLSSGLKKTVEQTQDIMDGYFEAFPGVRDNVMLKAHELVKAHGEVTNLFGRPRRLPEAKKFKKIYGATPHGELPYEVRNVLNLSVNHRIQSTGASIVNRSAIAFCKQRDIAGIVAPIVLQVHDSLIIECDEADAGDVAVLLQYTMENAVDLKTVALEAIPKCGKSLAEV